VTSGPDVAAAWLLTAEERDNPATTIDAAHADGRAWTDGNLVRVHVDGAAYFARLHALLNGVAIRGLVWRSHTSLAAARRCWRRRPPPGCGSRPARRRRWRG